MAVKHKTVSYAAKTENENSWVFGFSFRCVRNGLSLHITNLRIKICFQSFHSHAKLVMNEVSKQIIDVTKKIIDTYDERNNGVCRIIAAN